MMLGHETFKQGPVPNRTTPSINVKISREARIRNERSRVLLAICLLADDSGLVCSAGRKAIALQAGVSYDTITGHFGRLVYEKKLIQGLDRAGGRTVFVFPDHPDCERYLRWLRLNPRTRGPAPGLRTTEGSTAHDARI